MSNFKKTFEEEKIKELQEKLGIKNPMAVPRLQKIILAMSTKEFLADRKNIEKAKEELAAIAGQAPKVTRARVSVASFKLREGDKIGLMITLRGARMYDFFEKLVKIVLPRVRDFSGVGLTSFDGRGNMSIGFLEHIVFPEIDPAKIEKVRSLQLTLVTSAKNDEQAKAFLEIMGIPFKKEATNKSVASV